MGEYYSNYLKHAGVKGMKWGIRRYQNEDGTLTDAGKKRYARDSREKGYGEYDSVSGRYYKSTNKNEKNVIDANRYVEEDLDRSKKIVDASANLVKEFSNVNNSPARKSAPKMDLSTMTDQELREKINRALMEKQYRDLMAPANVSKGRNLTSDILDNAGKVMSTASTAIGLAIAIKKFMGSGGAG